MKSNKTNKQYPVAWPLALCYGLGVRLRNLCFGLGILPSETYPIAVISVGRDNNFGHPAPEVVERLQKNGIKIYRTDEEGAVVCRTDGKTLRIETFR